ncbi:helix-turn-helix domain-containing protein [Acinetobacter sp. SwsAc3]|jgi:DNA-binding transcriptional regulator YdaS (Cro superfamily)|nr:helix-turn-helix domain-containing protein [Acinetobacter sp. SwsAc3]
MSQNLIEEVVDHFGSQRKTALALGITQPTVNHMLSTGMVSVEVALKIQKKTNSKFLALDLRPGLKSSFQNIQVV